MERVATPPLAVQNGSDLAPSTLSGETTASGVSWAAVLGGAFVAAAMSLILLSLGTGLGLSSISPWSSSGLSSTAVGVGAVVWLIAAQIMAFALGGYIAGRLRIKWATVHTDEVYFRDTAHGLLVWAVGAVVVAGLLASVAASMVGSAARSGTGMRSGGGSDVVSDETVDPTMYAVDGMFRSDRAAVDRADPGIRGEVGRILAASIRNRQLAPDDRTYIASLVASRSGLSQADAEQRVTQGFATLQQAIDTARQTAAKWSLWIFVALLTGAFCASYAATIGGRQRDHVAHT